MRSALILLLILAGCSASPDSADSVATTPNDGVMVHLFEWRWADVAQECEEFLGPNGYEAVQVSPPSENHVIGGRPWYERYQPVSYQLETRSGTREEFADMVSRCASSGVDIVVDAIINHMTDADLEHESLEFTARGTAGTEFSSFSYPGLYEFDDFNHCGLTDNNDIQDWQDRAQLQDCELVDLADLKTSTPKVRTALAGYLADLQSLGVKGLRIDAARHIPAEDIRAILDEAAFTGYVVQEIAENAIPESEYFGTGAVTEFDYGFAISNAFDDGGLAAFIEGLGADHYAPSDKALVFVDNHDTQRRDGVLSYRDGSAYSLAQVTMLTWPYGRPRVMSSFDATGHENSPPAFEDESLKPVHTNDGMNCGNGEWVCEHRWPMIAGAVEFHAALDGVDEVTNLWTDGADMVAYGRGDQGFVAINASNEAMSTSLQTSLPEGAYCNRLAEGCEVVDVDSDGKLSATLESMTALAIDVHSRPE